MCPKNKKEISANTIDCFATTSIYNQLEFYVKDKLGNSIVYFQQREIPQPVSEE